jgi:Xaa-Pro aminopeptidase
LAAQTIIAVGNCGLYTGPWGVRIEDTVLVGAQGGELLTGFPRTLERERNEDRTDAGMMADGG